MPIQQQQQQLQLTEKDIVGDILTGTKYMAQGYMVAILESQDQNLRQTFKEFHDQYVNDHERIFQIMQKNGWYKVPMILDEAQHQR